MQEDKHLHLISFDIPYPADYGGVIDVYHKILALKNEDIKIILHCFHTHRSPQARLDEICEKVHYYKRSFLWDFFSKIPFIIASRKNKALLKNLSRDNYPILFEGLHTTFFLNHPTLVNRKKIVRLHNIEHRYYQLLAENESNFLKKIYFKAEALKLKHYEKKLVGADVLLPISTLEEKYYKEKFPSHEVLLINAFSKVNKVISQQGQGDFILYHGNLSISENERSALFLIEALAGKTTLPLKIAGKKPSEKLKLKAKLYNIELFNCPSDEKLSKLVSNAHINIVFSEFETGTKLKLLYVLFTGRFCIANKKVLVSDEFIPCCIEANDSLAIVNAVNELTNQRFTENDILIRKTNLEQRYSQEGAKIAALL